MRINKYLAESGVASRRACDQIINEGRVKINGRIAKCGDDVNEYSDSVSVDGKKVSPAKRFEYYVMNKPKGYVCTVKDDKGRKTVMDLLPKNTSRLFPVGRLDYDSEGMLLFTNDGDFANRLTHPSNEIPKTYLVKTEGEITDKAIEKLRGGVMVDGKLTKKCNIKVIETCKTYTKLHVTITEGRNREIRKMFESVGKNVDFLKRIKIGDLPLRGLDRGEVRKLTAEEVEYLKNV